jgi:hypothetical protein
MAVTGAIVCTPSSLTLPWGGNPSTGSQSTQGTVVTVDCALTLTNGGSSDVQVTACEPYALLNSAGAAPCALGIPPVGQGQSVNVPASGTLVLHFGFRPYLPQFASDGLAGGLASVTYTLGAFCKFSDGTIALSSTQTIVITAPAAP